MEKPLGVFCCYARKDQQRLNELRTHLAPLRHQGLVTLWADTDIDAGTEWEKELGLHLNTAHIILLLISPDFIASDYCYNKEMKRALERHERSEARVIPIILRPCAWKKAPFGKLQAMPRDAKPITTWDNSDEAFNDVSERLRDVVEEILAEEEKARRLLREAEERRRQIEKERLRQIAEEERLRREAEGRRRQIEKERLRREAEERQRQIEEKKLRLERLRLQLKRLRLQQIIVFWLILCFIGIGLVGTAFLIHRSSQPQPMISCETRTTDLRSCGSGLGISNTLIRGKEYTIGLNEDFRHQFDPTNADEKTIESLILTQNNVAEKAQHFTIVLATTLSKSTSDQYTGLEELRGALVAQQEYNNESHNTIKMRLLVANLGVKAIAAASVPIVARQIALYAANAPQKDHCLGVAGFPFSETLMSGLPVLQANQIPVVGSSPSSNEFSRISGFHRVEPSNSQQETYMLDFIQEVLHPQKIMILSDTSDDFSKDLGSGLTSLLTSLRNEVQTGSYIGGDKTSIDYAIRAIESTNPDLLLFTGFPADLNTLKTDMIQQGLRIPRILGSQTLYELGAYTQPKPGFPNNYANLIFSSFAFPDENTPSMKHFQRLYASILDPSGKFSGTYGKGRAGSHAALSYDAILAIQQAVDNSLVNGTLPSLAMVSNALNTVSFTGATGKIVFSPSSGSDPDLATSSLDILCTNHNAQTQFLIKYSYDNTTSKVDLSACN